MQTELKYSEIINLGESDKNINKNINKPHIESDLANKWNLVQKQHSRKQRIIGNKQVSEIKTVPKFASIHVYRLHPDTTTEDVEGLLKPIFPELECEKLAAKHKNLYASFKVSVYNHNFSKAMEPSIWPMGAVVGKFFYPRQKATSSG